MELAAISPESLNSINRRTINRRTINRRIRGVLLGLVCGDAWLAPYEGGVLERALWRVIGRTKGKLRFTDDTQMNLDILDEFRSAGELDQDSLARRFARSYRWSRGYGPEAGRVLKGVRAGKDWRELNRKRFPDGSFGNGAAMRAPAIAVLYFCEPELLHRKVREVSEITHCHPLGLDGAMLVAHTVAGVLNGNTILDSVRVSKEHLETRDFRDLCDRLLDAMNGDPLTIPEIRKRFGNSVLSTKSVPAALYLAHICAERPFDELLEHCRRLGGDADTIGAISGAAWGGVNSGEAIRNRFPFGVENVGMVEQAAASMVQVHRKRLWELSPERMDP